jgi:hydroxymethylbilane synthase
MEIRIGTRTSKLALVQTELISSAFRSLFPDMQSSIVDVKTLGDKKQGTPAASFGDKKDWIYELELGVLDGSFDIAVHSGKDVPSDTEANTVLVPVLARTNPFDAFVGRFDPKLGRRLKFSEVAEGARVGTASLRRKASLLRIRPDLEIVEHRGNVPTRVQKLDESADLQGIVLACAGLDRLGLQSLGYDTFDPEEFLPAINQGMLVVQYREGRFDLDRLLAPLIDPTTHAIWKAERAVVNIIEGDCKSCVGIFAHMLRGKLELISRVMLPTGEACIEVRDSDEPENALELGSRVGDKLLQRGAGKILEESRILVS